MMLAFPFHNLKQQVFLQHFSPRLGHTFPIQRVTPGTGETFRHSGTLLSVLNLIHGSHTKGKLFLI